MRSIIKLILWVSLLPFYCCQHINDQEVFNGNIILVNDNIRQEKNAAVKEVHLDGDNYGYVSAYDSLLIFMNPKLDSHFYQVFNTYTGEELGQFVKKGLGPDEIISTAPIVQFYKENEELKTLLFAANEEKVWIWNISRSLKQQATIIDTIYPCFWKKQGICYNEVFYVNNTFLMKVPAYRIGEYDASLPYYQQSKIGSQIPMKEFAVYKKTIKNVDSDIIPETFYYSNDALKPDGTKIVQAMLNLPQLNIVDLKSGKVTGYRLKGGHDFSVFKTDNKLKSHFIRIQADDEFIFAVYWGKDKWRAEFPYIDTIYVFNWDGELVQKIKTDCDIDEIALDNIKKRLYLTRPKHDEVYYIDLSNLY